MDYLRRTGHCNLTTLARLASALSVEPGELLVWYPVDKSEPDTVSPALRKTYMRKKPGLPRRSLKWWKPKEDEMLINLRAAGFTWKEIAARLGRTKESVKDRWFTITYKERHANDSVSQAGVEAE